MSPRVYYLFPSFPLVFAAGSVLWEMWLEARQRRWVRVAYPALMIAAGAIAAPVATPVLPVETYIRYTRALHLSPPASETHKLGPLPQNYASQFGWPEMVATVTRVYNSLPPDVRAKTAIFVQNYGQAGAIDLFGGRIEVPTIAQPLIAQCPVDIGRTLFRGVGVANSFIARTMDVTRSMPSSVRSRARGTRSRT